MFMSQVLESGSLPLVPRVDDGGNVASHKVYNPFARRQFSHPSSVHSVRPLEKGTQLVIGQNIHTNDYVIWADPALHD
jgi:hypothetical protein